LGFGWIRRSCCLQRTIWPDSTSRSRSRSSHLRSSLNIYAPIHGLSLELCTVKKLSISFCASSNCCVCFMSLFTSYYYPSSSCVVCIPHTYLITNIYTNVCCTTSCTSLYLRTMFSFNRNLLPFPFPPPFSVSRLYFVYRFLYSDTLYSRFIFLWTLLFVHPHPWLMTQLTIPLRCPLSESPQIWFLCSRVVAFS
jgi:hypothetical protein